MTQIRKPVGAHLVGSVPVKTAEEMFRLTMSHLKGYLKRLPDGEVGDRDTWIRWQYEKLGQSSQWQQVDHGSAYITRPLYRLIDGISSAQDIDFPNLGYADVAIESFAVFQRLTEEGVIPESVRFQVGLPTPLSFAILYVDPGSRLLFEEAYGQALKQEADKILAVIPAERLAVQWETVSEFALLEGLMENHLGDGLLTKITKRVGALIDSIPEPVEAGIHLSYGDSGHQHFCEPEDATFLAQVASGLIERANRPVSWIHMPVPKERDDAAYFSPLADLRLPGETELYLGLIHKTGGDEACRRRIREASRVVPRFGVATECGMGRRSLETIPNLMQQHKDVADPF